MKEERVDRERERGNDVDDVTTRYDLLVRIISDSMGGNGQAARAF